MTTKTDNARQQAENKLADIRQLVGEWLEHASEEAQQAIQELPLSVEVREPWHDVNNHHENPDSEYQILLVWGSPAVRIIGELDAHGEPVTARLEYQDWGTPWVEYYQYVDAEGAVLTFAQQFYYGA